MPAPEKSPRVLSPAGIERKQNNVRTGTERIEDDLGILDAAFDRLEGLITKAKAGGADVSAFQVEFAEKEEERERLEEEREELAKSARELVGKRGRIEGLEKKTFSDLFDLYEKRKASYPKEGKAVNKAGERLQAALDIFTQKGKGADFLNEMVVPYDPQTARVKALIGQMAGTSVDFRPLEDSVAKFDRLGAVYQTTSGLEAKRKADRAVREAKNTVKKAFSDCKAALEEAVKAANLAGAAAGDPTSKNELKEELVWIEHTIAKKLKDPKEKEAFIVTQATKEREILVNKNLQEKLGDEEKQKQFVKDIVKSLGVPLTTDELRALFERRKAAATRPAGGGGKRGGSAPAATYDENHFGEEMRDEITYQIDPVAITHTSADVRRRLQDRRVTVPSPFSPKLIELLGSAIEDGTPRAPQEKLRIALANLVQPQPATPGDPRSFEDVERGLDQISQAFLVTFNEPANAQRLIDTFTEVETARLPLDRRTAEAKIAQLLSDAEKAEKVEQKATSMRLDLEKAEAFIDKDLEAFGKKVEKDHKIWEAADKAHKKQEEVRQEREKGLKALEEGFNTQIAERQTKIEKANEAITKINTDRLTALIKEHDDKKKIFEEKKTRLASLESLLGKIYNERTDQFVLRDETVVTSDAAILREVGPGKMISSLYTKRAGSTKAEVTALEHLTEYKRAVTTDFFTPEMKAVCPQEFTSKSPAELRADSARIQRKCELIEEGKVAAKVALGVIDNGPVPTFAAPGPKPQPQPQKTLVDWTDPVPGFFDRFSEERKRYDTWKKNREEDERINRDRKANDADLLREWNEKITKANEEMKNWEDRLIAFAKILSEQSPNLAPTAIDVTQHRDELRLEVAAACVEALKPMILIHNALTGRKDQSVLILEAMRPEIEHVEKAEVDQYKKTLMVMSNMSGTLRKIQGMKGELTAYAKARHAEKEALKDEVDDLKAEVEPLEQERERLEKRRSALAAEVTTWEEEKTSIAAEKVKQVAAFTAQTPLLIEQADPHKDMEKWVAHSYDHTKQQEELAKKAEGIVLDLVKELTEWNAVAGEYPERDTDESIAYLTARRDVKKSLERIKAFLSERGATVKDGLADVRALKTRLEQALSKDQRGRRENVAIQKEIYATFEPLGEVLKKDAGTA